MTDSKNPHVDENGKKTNDSAKSLDQTIGSEDSRSQMVQSDNQGSETSFQGKVRIMPKLTEDLPSQSAIDDVNASQNENADLSEEGMEDIAQKLEADLLSELQTALEKPLVIPNEEGSSGNGPQHLDSGMNNEPESAQSVESDSGIQPNKEEVSIRILQESRNSSWAQSGQNPTNSEDSNPISSPTEEINTSDQISEKSEDYPEANKRRFELSDSEANPPDAEVNIETQNRDDSPDTTHLGENSLRVSPENYQRHTNQRIDENEVSSNLHEDNDSEENQMSLPGIQERETSAIEDNGFDVSSVQNPYPSLDDSKLHPPIAESTTVQQNTSAKRGVSVSFVGFLLLLIGGGALFAYSTFTSEPESSTPILIAADKSPMKIFPESDGTDEVQSTNGKIVFDRVAGIDSDFNGRLVVPEQVEIADLSELAESSESSISATPQTRTVVVRPDGTVIEGELAGNSTNQDSISDIEKVELDGSEESSADESGESTVQPTGISNESVAQQSENLEREEEHNESIIAQVENLLESSDNPAASADIQASADNPAASVESQATTDNTSASADIQASADNPAASAESQATADNTATSADNQATAINSVASADRQASTDITVSDNGQDQQESETIRSISGTEVSDVADSAETGEVTSEPLVQLLPKPKPENLENLLVATNSAPNSTPASEETTSNTSDNSSFPLIELEPGTPVAQILADKNIETARNGYESIRRNHPNLLQDYSPVVQIGETDTGTWYRVQIEMDIYEEAENLCRQLRQQGQDCVPKIVAE